jgi:hypothetical protein
MAPQLEVSIWGSSYQVSAVSHILGSLGEVYEEEDCLFLQTSSLGLPSKRFGLPQNGRRNKGRREGGRMRGRDKRR